MEEPSPAEALREEETSAAEGLRELVLYMATNLVDEPDGSAARPSTSTSTCPSPSWAR